MTAAATPPSPADTDASSAPVALLVRLMWHSAPGKTLLLGLCSLAIGLAPVGFILATGHVLGLLATATPPDAVTSRALLWDCAIIALLFATQQALLPIARALAHACSTSSNCFRGTPPAGGVVAIVGENGSGKTTLVKLLSRFYAPSAGRILIDGADLATFDAPDWRRRMTAAFQDFARLQFSARDAVGVGDLSDASDARVRTALHRAGADDWERWLPHGLDTQLGTTWDRGVELSGGQWQKIALARTLMRDEPLLLVLDEPAASLDPLAEHRLFERQAEATRAARSRGAVTLLVSHLFSTVRMADLIIVLERGEVRETGSHAELVQRGGLYAGLFPLPRPGVRTPLCQRGWHGHRINGANKSRQIA